MRDCARVWPVCQHRAERLRPDRGAVGLWLALVRVGRDTAMWNMTGHVVDDWRTGGTGTQPYQRTDRARVPNPGASRN